MRLILTWRTLSHYDLLVSALAHSRPVRGTKHPWHSFSPKILDVCVAGQCAGVLLLVLGAFLAACRRTCWQNAGRRLCFDIAFLLFFIAIFPVGDWMLRPLENRFLPLTLDHVDGIVVIGSDENPLLSEARGQPVMYHAAASIISSSPRWRVNTRRRSWYMPAVPACWRRQRS